MANIQRRKSVTSIVGGVRVGSSAPIVVQSMTNTDTADIPGTVKQVAALARAGSELVRVTVNNDEAAAAVAPIVDELDKLGVSVPIIGDFHYNGHLLLTKYPECARALAKYRINPGNVSVGRKDDDNFRTMGSINFGLLGALLVGSLPGIFIGSYFAVHVPERALRLVLATTLLVVASRMAYEHATTASSILTAFTRRPPH